MNILLFDGYFSDSHAHWAKALQKHSRHQVDIFSLPGYYWKWRMQGAAINFTKTLAKENPPADLFLCSDMLNLPIFKSLLPKQYSDLSIALYMHENQLTYPWSKDDREMKDRYDKSYGFINYSSALVADEVFFNSHYHMNSFLDGVEKLLRQLPDHRNLDTVIQIEKKSKVLSIGIELEKFNKHRINVKNDIPIILWNHRWEFDKNPTEFFNALFRLKEEDIPFQVVIIGKEYHQMPEIFKTAKEVLTDEIVQYGFVENYKEYIQWLWRADIAPVTNIQDFFGISVVEAIACGCYTLLPDRLSYPEHLNQTKYPDNFYAEGEFYNKLKQTILQKKYLETQDSHHKMQKYGWQKLIHDYDDTFENLITS